MLRMNSVFGRVALVSALALVGCGGPLRYTLRGSARAAGADANLVADVDTSRSLTRLNARASNLAPPDRIQTGATAFVVWERTDGAQGWVRVSTLDYDPATRVGELRDISVPETRFEIQITAEANAQPLAPSSHVVFTQRIGATRM